MPRLHPLKLDPNNHRPTGPWTERARRLQSLLRILHPLWKEGRAGAWVSWGVPILGGLFLAIAYSPGLTHMDSQMRWIEARGWVEGDPCHQPSDWFSPFLIGVCAVALKAGISYVHFHYAYVAMTTGACVYAVTGLFDRGWHRVFAYLVVAITPLGLSLAAQAADLWVAAGLLLVTGSTVRRIRGPAGWTAAGAYFLGSLLVFGGRYNGLQMVPLLLLLPWMARPGAPRRSRVIGTALAATAFGAVLLFNSLVAFRPAHKKEVYMGVEIVGMWHYAHGVPGAVAPEFIAELPDPDSYTDDWHGIRARQLMWSDPTFLRHCRKEHLAIVERDYRWTLLHYPGAFLRVRGDALAAGWGLTAAPVDVLFRLPPKGWMDRIGLDLQGTPPWPGLASAVDRWAGRRNRLWNRCWRPWILTLVVLALALWRVSQRRMESATAAGLLLMAGYAATIVPCSQVYIPRYFLPCAFLAVVLSLKLLLEAGPTAGIHPRADRAERSAPSIRSGSSAPTDSRMTSAGTPAAASSALPADDFARS